MVSIPKVVGVMSCGFLLCLGLSHAAQADNEASAANEMKPDQSQMKADQSDRRQGGQEAGEKQMSDEMKGGPSKGGKTITGEMLRVEVHPKLSPLDPFHDSAIDQQRLRISRHKYFQGERHPEGDTSIPGDVAPAQRQIFDDSFPGHLVPKVLYRRQFLEPLMLPHDKPGHPVSFLSRSRLRTEHSSVRCTARMERYAPRRLAGCAILTRSWKFPAV